MSFDFRVIRDFDVELYDSEVESEVQLIFLPGSMDPRIWKHQLRYFSNDYRVLSFKNKDSSIYNELNVLEGIFNEFELDNVILFSCLEGNITSRCFDNFEENIIGRVFVGNERDLDKIGIGKITERILSRFKHPKLVKKLFFDSNFPYRGVKEFSGLMNFSDFSGYRENLIEESYEKEFLRIEGELNNSDINSSRFIDNSGLFPFFEKPEEFNEVSVNYLKYLIGLMEDYRLSKVERKNKRLKNYEDEKGSESVDKSLKKIVRE